ncbi:PREDICTED: spermatogenesis-associated protein 21 isoform X2 [Chinchilla lanigera]|uniref:spermatogenesis-associated protein 21 isoform X2 n=1 Tax=Chinchilla lanigera TaxID=34839 RepID=UPI000695FD04|nr:PREDICTED: spermatogenesis-associated protein 21 isoform X2 [Chinchilla lanigera]
MMANRNTQMDAEDQTEDPGLQPRPVLSPIRKRADAESTVSAIGQADFPDAAEMRNEKQLLSTLGGAETGLQHTEASEEGCSELGTQEHGPPERPRPHAIPEGLQQPGTEPEDQQGRPRKPGTGEDQPREGRQDPECQSPGQQAENGVDTVQRTEPCALDSCVQPLGDDPRREAGDPRISPREALCELAAGGHKGSSQEAMCPMPVATAEENTATSLLPSILGPRAPQEGAPPSPGVSPLCRGETAETQAVPRPLLTTEASDIEERRDPGHTQKAQESESPGNPGPGFMKCLLEAEEEEAAHRRAWKARVPTARKSPRTLKPGPTSVRISYSAPLTLPQAPTSAPPTTPLWARPPAPTPVAVLVLGPGPVPVLRAPFLDLGWRRMERLPQSHEWSPSCARPWQETEAQGLLRLCQGWEEQAEEHLTLKQEEAFRSYFEIFNGPGEVDTQSLKNILVLVGFSLTPAQVEAALLSADVNGDGHVDFKDFLAVMTDTRRFFCSMEQNAMTNVAAPNPHTLLFEILSLLVEMLALPEAVLEEITSYYQKKLKEGTCKAREMPSAIGQLRSQKQVTYNHQQADRLEAPERRVLSILSRLKQNASDLQSPYAQVPCVPLYPRLNKKMAHRKQGSHSMLNQCAPASLSPSTHRSHRSLFFQSGPPGSREHSSDGGKWLSSLPTRTR